MVKLVNRADFAAKIKKKRLALFSARDVQTLFGVSPAAATMILHRYSKRGFITRIKRGLYLLPDALPPEVSIYLCFYVNGKYYCLSCAEKHKGEPQNSPCWD